MPVSASVPAYSRRHARGQQLDERVLRQRRVGTQDELPLIKRAESVGLHLVIQGLRGSAHIESWHPWAALDKIKMPIRDGHGGKWQKHSRIFQFDLPDRNRISQTSP